MGVLLQDLAYAFRQLRKTPGFTATVLLTLALGIGANSAIFTLVNSVLLSNLPVADPRTLIRIGDRDDCCVSDGIRDDGDMSLFSTCRSLKNWPPWSPAMGGDRSVSAVTVHEQLASR